MPVLSSRRLATTALCGAAALATAVAYSPGAVAGPAHSTGGLARHVASAQPESKPDFDSRVGSSGPRATELARTKLGLEASRSAGSLRASVGGQALLDMDPVSGTPRQVARLDGLLTPASAASPAVVALDYVRTHAGVFGLSSTDLAHLRLVRTYRDIAGTTHLSWQQVAGGIPLFGNGLQASVTKAGSLVTVQGAPVRDLSAPAPGRSLLSGSEAVAKAREDLGEPTSAGPLDTSTQVLFHTASGTVLAWQTVTMSAQHPALHVVDAQSGRVLYRRSLSSDANAGTPLTAQGRSGDATGLAYAYFPGASHGGTAHTQDFTAQGWLAPGATKLSGNNTHTYADVNDDNASSPGEEIPPLRAHDWLYPLKPFHLPNVSFCDNPYPCSWNPRQPFSWTTNRDQNATQVFTFVNRWHDHLLLPPIGFTEAAGNFQRVNATGQGAGGDAVNSESDDGANTDPDHPGLPDASHVDNANMDTPPDGQPPRMQMYLQHLPGTTYPGGDPFAPTNVGDEADTVYHEYTHGLSNRLVVDPAGNSTLGNVQAGSMGEAWSDWYAMDYLVDKGLQADTPVAGDVVLFQYDGAGVKLDRTEPLDCTVGTTSTRCPGTPTAGRGGYTYGDFGNVIGYPEVHADGEIWSQTLWDLRRALGSTLTESLVTRAMELSPSNPSFLDERNAILLADTADYLGHHRGTIWSVFAHRGMGWFAGSASGDDVNPVQDFSLPPPAGTPRGTVSGVVRTANGHTPVAGASVVFGGHASGMPFSWSDTTDAQGRFSIPGVVVGSYPRFTVSARGYDDKHRRLDVHAGSNTIGVELVRDWASTAGGASVTAFDGPDFGSPCGPDQLFDQSLGSGWVSTADLSGGAISPRTPKQIVVKLPSSVQVSSIQIDPNAACGVGGSASLAGYSLETSSDGSTWRPAAGGTFGVDDRGHLNRVPLSAGSATDVRWVRLTMKSPQVFAIGGSCPGPYGGCDYMSASELEVYGTAG